MKCRRESVWIAEAMELTWVKVRKYDGLRCRTLRFVVMGELVVIECHPYHPRSIAVSIHP